MNVDSYRDGFYHLFLAVTVTIVGTFHSSTPIHSPVVAENMIVENKIYPYQGQIVPPQTNPVAGILAIEKVNEDPVPALLTNPAELDTPTTAPTPFNIATYYPTSTPTPTLEPTNTPTPTTVPKDDSDNVKAASTENKQGIVLDIPPYEPSTNDKSLNADLILEIINNHRKDLNLPPFIKDEQLCRLAEYRKPQLYDEIFTTGTVHKGLYDLNLPYYITENMASYGSEEAIVNWWLGSFIHRAAIEGNAKYSCGACSGNSCAQLFTNYIPKS